jgi:indolepyruvate ferredoxin oxidoreductase beta subunit
MSSTALPSRPITIMIAALGGEGGGVFADWLVAAAHAQGYPVQSTSIPGVAQRTGATNYYIEIYPAKLDTLGGRLPVLALMPSPGAIDVLAATEYMEAGRAMQNGYVSAGRTTLIASTHRVYVVAEKIAMGDGRYDGERIAKAAPQMAKRALLFDMQELARESGTIINAVLFGAMAGAGVLPLTREACENAIRAQGKGAEASLRGFAAGYERAAATTTTATNTPETRTSRGFPVDRVRKDFPAETHRILEEGVARLTDYQDAAYATLYLDRLAPVLKADRDGGGGPGGYKLTNETARFMALWMSYEDLIRVADLKTRPERMARLRAEVGAAPHEPVVVAEFLMPGVDEIASVLPPAAARPLLAWAKKRGKSFNVSLQLKTSTISGHLLMRLLAWMRPLRRQSLRFADEHALMARWLRAVEAAAAIDVALALEVAECQRLVKGYGDTHKRGTANFLAILDTLIEIPQDGRPELTPADRAAAIRKARVAALADPEGRALAGALARPVVWLTQAA